MNDKNVKKALVIEDETTICILCERVLGNKGFQVDIVNDGKTAETAIAVNIYDLILVDIRLPGESGMDLYTWLIQAYPRIAEKVIFMTGSIMDEDIMHFLQTQGRPSLVKPFRPDELLKIIDEIPDQN